MFRHKRFLLARISLIFLHICTFLPYRWQLNIGKTIGHLGYFFFRRRKHIAKVNLKLCFPQLKQNSLNTLLKKHFLAVGMGLIESGIAWWMSDQRFKKLGAIEGFEHIQTGLARGKGILLLSAHFTTLEMAARIVGRAMTLYALYRPQKNPVFNQAILTGRGQYLAGMIERSDLRKLIKTLKKNHAVYYAADQDYGAKHSLFIPFFGLPAATITATLRLAELTQASIIPVFHYRYEQPPYYRVVFHPPLQNFPTGQDETDLKFLNGIIEQAILKAPEQYFWIHRRFKTRPLSEKSPYAVS